MSDATSDSSSADFWFAVRGLGFCFRVCAVLNVVGALRKGFDANLWWIDLRFLPAPGRALLTASLGALLIAAFGTTDYRRPADAIVVFGAKVRNDGTASIVLRERVARASELYRAGLAGTVVMTGGIEPTGVDETLVMRDLAVARGVPAEAIVLDRLGVTTNASVERTVEILRGRELTTVLAVSQPYHLPRIKLAYARAGLDVWTVPADVRLVPDTARLVAREIPAFWLYYLQAVAG